jgi:aminoglycoside phosphotransferase (APT) family kinase protein
MTPQLPVTTLSREEDTIVASVPTESAETGNVDLSSSENRTQDHLVEDAGDDDLSEGDSHFDDASSDISMTSTIEYSQESYETFKDKCLELILQIFKGRTAEQIRIHRVAGGSYNRIIGVTVDQTRKRTSSPAGRIKNFIRKFFGSPTNKPCATEQYVLRIPRFASNTGVIPYHAATLGFVNNRLRCPVPTIVFGNTTENNPLGSGYVIQRRLSGTSLAVLWDHLTLEQKRSAVRQVSQITVEMTNITNSCAGIISILNGDSDLKGTPKLETFPVPKLTVQTPEFTKPNTLPAKPQTTKDLMIEQCERWREYEEATDGYANDEIWDGFIRVINKLHALGFLPDEDPFHFCHLDFQARNILAEVKGDGVTITGVLDWDSAVFAPKFMAKRAPFWVWQDEDADELDETQATSGPLAEEETELKKVFEENVDTDFLRYAYSPEYIFARRIFRFLHEGILYYHQEHEAMAIVEDFEELYPSEE